MSVQQKRVFRIEKYINQMPAATDMFEAEPVVEIPAIVEHEVAPVPQVTEPVSVVSSVSSNIDISEMRQEIMSALERMNDEIIALKSSQIVLEQNTTERHPEEIDGDYSEASPRIPPMSAEDVEDARKLRNELKEIYDAIEQTKVEILTIHQSGVNGMEISRVTDELGAIVGGTEKATETILETAEGIDAAAGDLVASLTDETLHGLASDIQDGVVKIFESCNFQDLTGQRISKVISAFRFIEERVIQMMEIWGGIDSFSEIDTELREDRQGDRALLNGPALEEDDNVASQDDIDALFD